MRTTAATLTASQALDDAAIHELKYLANRGTPLTSTERELVRKMNAKLGPVVAATEQFIAGLAVREQLREVEHQLDASKEADRQHQRDMLAAMGRLQRDRQVLESEVDRLQQGVGSLQGEIAALRTQLATQLNAPVAA